MSTLVFISHSHADQEVAQALVDFLLAAIELDQSSLRCTSVPGHQLQFGRTISELLKTDIDTSAAILVLLTKDSLRSEWVMFELGACWALGKIVVPILGHNQTAKALPGPLAAYPGVLIDAPDAPSRLADAVSQIATTLGLRERTGGKREDKLITFVDLARSREGGSPGPKSRITDLIGRRLDRREWIRLLDEIIPDADRKVLLAVKTKDQKTFIGYADWSGGKDEPVYGFVGPEKERFETPLSKIDTVEVLRVD
jgi:hypothetical protein